METNDIKKLHGRKFIATIADKQDVKGVITVEDRRIYLCQNYVNGRDCINKQGYKYSYVLPNGTFSIQSDKNYYSVTNLRIMSWTKQEIEEYKDFKTGDVVINTANERYTIGPCFDNYCLAANKEQIAFFFTKEELYNKGYRLHVPKEEIHEDVVEVTLEEIAKLKGISVEQLRIKE